MGTEGVGFPLVAGKYSNEAALSLRSRRNGTKFAEPVGSLIKCRRLPRGFFWNSFLAGASFIL